MTRHYVFVPGIGGFLLRDIDASYVNNVYTPSHREVHFNRFLTKDDGMLANAMMTAERISFDEAISQIRIEVAGIISEINKKKQVGLGSLGILTLDSDHHLTLKNAKHFPLDPETYGLGKINLRGWKEIEEEKNKPILKVSKQKTEDPDVVSIPKHWLRRAVACILIVLCLFANFNPSDNGRKVDYAAIVNTEILFGNFTPNTLTEESWDNSWESEEVLAEIESNLEIEEILTEQKEEEIPEPEVVVEPEPAPTLEKIFYIIIGSCLSIEEANQAIKNREKMGYENIGILERDGRFRLYLKTFTTRAEAEPYLAEVRATTPFQNAWLLPVQQ